ncbi:MAG: diacylglycerol kinase family protein [bacterium]|nr:diacylglycerol kinase family protein [bacterium]
MNENKEQKAWRDVRYSRKFLNAFRGMYIIGKTTRHISIHLLSAFLVVVLGFYFHVSATEWMMLVFAIGFVFMSEAFNTSIEIDIDLTSPEYHPYARDTKDVAAAAVLLSVFTATAVGLIIFLPPIIAKIF